MGDHTPTHISPAPAPATLPDCLARWAGERGQAVAIRHKLHGDWVAWTWADLQAEVARAALALAAWGFGPDDVVAIAAGPAPQALAVTLAAQGLGGGALWVEPEEAGPPAHAEAGQVFPPARAPRFGYARDEATLAHLRARFGSARPWLLGLYPALQVPHRSSDETESAVRTGSDVAGDGGPQLPAPLRARPRDAAFLFAGHGAAGLDAAGARRPARLRSLTHGVLVAAGRAWVEAEALDADHQAFAWEAPVTEAGATFVASWLVAGFTLALPEDATTADADRREVQPTVVAATAVAYGRLWQQVTDSLPVPGSLLRALVNAGLAPGAGWLGRALGGWLVRRPLRKLLGLGRIEAALVLGAASPPAPARELLAGLGVRLRAPSPFAALAGEPAALFEPVPALPSSSALTAPGPT